jgi:CBS domain containing-hemolysin-like protein
VEEAFHEVRGINLPHVMRAVEDGGGLGAQVKTEDVMREVLTVPENRRVDAVLQDLKDRQLRMAIVIDEWGSFEGIITMEDIVEEIVGEIRDEFDGEGPAVSELPDGSYSMDGLTPIEEANRALGSGFASEDFFTVGGLVFGRLGHAPRPTPRSASTATCYAQRRWTARESLGWSHKRSPRSPAKGTSIRRLVRGTLSRFDKT